MKNEVASLMNNEKLMKIFAVAKINRNYSLFTIHYSFLISHTFWRRDVLSSFAKEERTKEESKTWVIYK